MQIYRQTSRNENIINKLKVHKLNTLDSGEERISELEDWKWMQNLEK